MIGVLVAQGVPWDAGRDDLDLADAVRLGEAIQARKEAMGG